MSCSCYPKHRVVMHVFCEDCGDSCHPCDYCQKRVSYGPGSYCTDCYRDFGYANQMFYLDDPDVKPQFICLPCQEERDQCSAEVFGYLRWAADSSKPLSPTNCYRCPRFRKLGEGTTDPIERADEALAAYEEELAFSGNSEEAFKIYVSFYNRKRTRVSDPKALREGFVSMEEILNGQHVTGEQFFAAFREAIDYGDEEEIGNNPKTMSDDVLNRAFLEVTDDREALYHWAKQNQEWTEHDIALMRGLDDWAEKLYDEIQSR